MAVRKRMARSAAKRHRVASRQTRQKPAARPARGGGRRRAQRTTAPLGRGLSDLVTPDAVVGRGAARDPLSGYPQPSSFLAGDESSAPFDGGPAGAPAMSDAREGGSVDTAGGREDPIGGGSVDDRGGFLSPSSSAATVAHVERCEPVISRRGGPSPGWVRRFAGRVAARLGL